MVTGAVIWFLWTAFFDAAQAIPLGICQVIFDKVTLLRSPWTAVDPIMIALPISLAVIILMQWQSVKQQPSKTATAAE
jgi:SSS family solute:Na+ symporter